MCVTASALSPIALSGLFRRVCHPNRVESLSLPSVRGYYSLGLSSPRRISHLFLWTICDMKLQNSESVKASYFTRLSEKSRTLEKSSNACQFLYSGLRIMGQLFIEAIMFEEIFSMLRLSHLSVFFKSRLVFSFGLSLLPVYLSLYKRASSPSHRTRSEADSQLSSDT